MKRARLSLAIAALGFVCLFLLLSHQSFSDDPVPKDAKSRRANRLAKETSPYLLMHAKNPVDWYAWGPEAFEKAKKEGKLIFLSIGYSSCYWCHVMARESFENDEVAKLLNDWFVCIKVDREERPDIDHIYMTALIAATSGRGGWPLSMFLTSDGRPIAGGTYWPREDKEEDGERYFGFKSILTRMHKLAGEDPKRLEKLADGLASSTRRYLDGEIPGKAIVALDRKLVNNAAESVKERFDKVHGGFGSAARSFRGPKFPSSPSLDLALQLAPRDAELHDVLTVTLTKMAQGGIYDQLGGGFHRYTVERTWTVPHFEKMLYDNAQLVELYARAYRLTKDPLYRRVVAETVAYIKREMMSPEGAFYSSQDAETDHEEGRSYVWTNAEIDAVFPDKAENKKARTIFGATGKYNFEEKYHILTFRWTTAELAKELGVAEDQVGPTVNAIKKKLFEARNRRHQPFVNKIALTAWSGLMIAGLAEAGQALKEPSYTETAAKAATLVLEHQVTKDGRILRSYGGQPGKAPTAQVNGYLEDYTGLVHGLLTLHDATGDKKWLDHACKLTNTMIRFHGETKAGGYYFTANDHEKLFARSKDQYDGVQPSGNSQALLNLVRLWRKTGDKRYQEEAQKGFETFAATLQSSPTSVATMVRALDLYLEGKR
jgi:uncharacterized protein YyaL (SSP411 family)